MDPVAADAVTVGVLFVVEQPAIGVTARIIIVVTAARRPLTIMVPTVAALTVRVHVDRCRRALR